MGIKGETLSWFRSYLEDRKQKVQVNGELSDTLNLDISVLQGSILGPILFLIMINDLPLSSNLNTSMFADNTLGLAKGKNLPELMDFVNQELGKWATWFRANKLKVNTTKTKYIIFHTKGKKIDLQGREIFYNDNEPGCPQNPALVSTLDRVHNNHIEKSSRSYKLLGIEMDEHLSFNSQTNALHSKLAKSIYCINKVKNFLPPSALKTLYFSLVHSHLNYCTSIYTCTSKSNTEKIFKLH
jgi:hypothetical protein